MVLRKAKLEDFEVYKKLYEDTEGSFQFLYFPNKNNTVSESINFFVDESIMELYTNYTLDKFQKDLNSSLIIFMIEDNDKILGYVSLFYCGNYTYKIAEWAMLNPNNNEKKKLILQLLKKSTLPRLRKFSICTVNNNTIEFLMSNGFKNSSSTFYYLEI